jgi:hypothetical protein
MATPTAEEIEKKLQQHIDFINATITKVRNGVLSNIDPLENAMQKICEEIKKLPPAESRTQIEGLMVEMTGKLEQLAVELIEFQNKLKKHHGID